MSVWRGRFVPALDKGTNKQGVKKFTCARTQVRGGLVELVEPNGKDHSYFLTVTYVPQCVAHWERLPSFL